ncbi:MAG: hypothetical protein J0H49_36005 [Acidobacteria bacterium]|nr:hypothetical protein [Acidobacteriota bacterium]
MITPNKAIALHDSALSRVGYILREGPAAVDLHTLYERVSPRFESIDQFLVTLDILFVLGRIDLKPATRTVTYVG